MEKLRQRIIQGMMSELDEPQLEKLTRVLDIVLYDYEVTEKSRELVNMADTDSVILKNYIGSKLLEGCSENTARCYLDTLERMARDINKPICQITTDDIRYHLAKWKTERQCSSTTINNMRMYYSAFFKWLYTERYISENPMERIKAIKCEKKVIEPFTQLEREQLLDACETTRDRALLEFLYSTGCRVSECINIKIDDVNFLTNEVMIRHGKGNKDRVTYLSESAKYWLQKYLKERKSDSEYIWIGRQGCLKKSGVEAIVRKIGRKCGIDAHPHKFRHSFTTDLIGRGAAITDVQVLLGHESISTTTVYFKHSQDDIKNTHKKYIA